MLQKFVIRLLNESIKKCYIKLNIIFKIKMKILKTFKQNETKIKDLKLFKFWSKHKPSYWKREIRMKN